MNQRIVDGILITRPTREDIESLKIGDLAPDCFGNVSKVVTIFAKKEDISGKLFACYYVEFGSNGGTISNSIKEGEPVPTIPATSKYFSTRFYPSL
jgi:hypothetical protein